MEFGSIEREIHVDASPETVFAVVTSPEHIREWWGGAETDLTPTPGTVSSVGWGDHVEPLTVVDVDAPRLFSFRWVFDGAGDGPSLLVTFELAPSGAGTLLRMTETGFREKGWEIATLEAAYADHVEGWDRFVPAIAQYAAGLVSTP
ncbi:SRPBCC family protein [Cellulomonas terrae]|uniref:Activator of HSP90 ATPase n=1 Tax=Cellulomonas terrae TaxID=311234 RepID=A0A511JJP8_9CELL|nr:SRPBCC family protein [Cellulomonas terrae]GEL98237.1 activator of HSP90 ATPase [Cellulomonas terrae]